MDYRRNEQMAILVISCDKYADLWYVFFDLWAKFWPDCPYQMYIGSNYIKCERENVNSICIGEDLSWAENVSKMLDQIDESYVLIMMEDVYLCERVDSERFKKLLSYVVEHKLDCLHLRNHLTGIRRLDKKLGIQCIEAGSPYYVHAVDCIWRKDTMKRFLVPGYNAWDFELKNSKTVRPGEQNFAAVEKDMFVVKNGVVRGKYLKSTVDYLNLIGVKIDTSKRGILEDTATTSRLSKQLTRLKMLVYVKLRLYKVGFIRNRLNI